LILLGLFFRIWNLQIINGDKYRSLSENNRIASRVVRSPRGVIFDAEGKVLADNRPSFNIYLIEEDTTNLKEEIRLLAVATDQPYEKIRQRVRKSSPFRPLLIKADADRRSVAFIEEHRPELPGVFIQVAPLRHYPYGDHAGHLLGYLGEVNGRQLKKLKKLSYRQGDLLGKYGVEFSHEKHLRGETGFKQVEVDAYGREFKVVKPFIDKPGNNIQLTLNYGLQKKAEELFKDYEGSIIAIDPTDGAILAMVSKPSFDPNKFASGILKEDWRALTTDPLKPLQNRATRGQYPPGSIFKIVMAFATQAEKILSPTEKIQCYGTFPFGGRVFNDWKRGGHGPVDLTQSLAQSCDVYYYQVGNKLGIERIARYSRMFGLGSPTGFAPREKGGLVPSNAWKKRRFKEKWYRGETISVSIGQGFNLVTPMQVANLIATTANGGNLWKPYIVKRIFGKNGSIVFEHKPTLIRKIPLDKKIFQAVQNGLKEVVNGVRGTAKKARIPGVIVAGKTGTAQTVRLAITGRKRKPESLPRKFRDHGWFVAYAPFEEPKIAVAILGEHAGRSGSFFAPIAKELISHHLQIKKSKKVLAYNSKTPTRQAVLPNRAAEATR
ncbi:MAG: penicillin-binding protein 2, partial [Nitrospinaceae bacterium]|nr:penicillin-binding protein 2 [Nitrospinaceae bacterium]